MRKIKIYGLLTCVCLMMQSCLFNEDDIFDESSAQRAIASVNECQEILKGAANGWLLEYYTGEDGEYGGFNVLARFDGNNVIMAADFATDNYEIGEESTSLYKVESYQGTELSFDSYNELIHEFCEPSGYNSPGYAEIMKNGLVRPEDMKGFSERIYNEASRLITLVEDIIKISKLDEKSIELEKQEVDLYLLVREICTRLAPQAEKKSVRFEVSGEHVSYNGIRQILDEMIYNLCENAVKYNVKGGKVSVWTGNTLEGPKVIVEDTGIGIPEEEKERVFERFYRVDKSHSRENGGTGLGLSIVKHGALLHDAKIQISSNLGKGTKIELIFGGDSRKETDSENDR